MTDTAPIPVQPQPQPQPVKAPALQKSPATSSPPNTAPVSSPESLDRADRFSRQKSIYDAGVGEIFLKNFLAGFSRALGGIFLYLIFLAVMGYLFIRFMLPAIQPLLNLYAQSLNSLQQLQQVGKNGLFSIPGITTTPTESPSPNSSGTSPTNQTPTVTPQQQLQIQDLLKNFQLPQPTQSQK